MLLGSSRSIAFGLVATAACARTSPPAGPTTQAPTPGPGAASDQRTATGAPVDPELPVPFSTAPTIDGTVHEAEWSRATAIALGRGATLRVLHDGKQVYLAVSGLSSTELAFACLFIAEPDHIRVLHASAKLGSAICSRR